MPPLPAEPRVLIYAMNFAPEFAGVGKYNGELAEMLEVAGYRVSVVTTPPHYPGWQVVAPYHNRYSLEAHGGVRVLRAPLVLRRRMGGIWRLIAPVSFAITSAPRFIWEALRRPPGLIVCIEPTLAVAPLSLLMARLTGARTLLHVQDLEVDAAFSVGHVRGPGWLRRLALACERFILQRFDLLMTISQAMATRLADKQVPAERIAILRNWVDLARFGPQPVDPAYRVELGLPIDAFLVLYSGNIGAKQELGQLLEAARLLVGRDDIHIAVAGDGPAREALWTQYGDLANVTFLPFQPVERLNAFLNLADLHALIQGTGAADLVLPSKLGGMLASGRPIIVTAEPGSELSDFLLGQATIVPPNAPERLASAIVALADAAPVDRPVARPDTVSRLAATGAQRRLERLTGRLLATRLGA